jgi:hypothetical protein
MARRVVRTETKSAARCAVNETVYKIFQGYYGKHVTYDKNVPLTAEISVSVETTGTNLYGWKRFRKRYQE